jgi:hypothetical protein
MKKNIFSMILIIFSFIALMGAFSYYAFEKGYIIGEYTGAYDICSNNNMLLSFDDDFNYKCKENKTDNKLNYYVEGYYGS